MTATGAVFTSRAPCIWEENRSQYELRKGETMSSEPWKSGSAREGNESNEAKPQGEWSMEDVLRRTLDAGQGDDVVDTIDQLRKDNPAAKPDEIDTMTRFVLAFLKKRFPDLPLKSEKVLLMASTIAQSLIEDPVASERIRLLWAQSS